MGDRTLLSESEKGKYICENDRRVRYRHHVGFPVGPKNHELEGTSRRNALESLLHGGRFEEDPDAGHKARPN